MPTALAAATGLHSDADRERRWGCAATLLAALAVAVSGLYPGGVPDTFGHLAHGRDILEQGALFALDRRSLLEPPRAFHNYEWLSDLIFYALYRGFGYDALIALKCSALFASALGLGAIARRLGGAPAEAWCALSVLGAIPACRYRFTDRPHVLGLAAAVLSLWLLCALSRGLAPRRRLLAALFATHVLWVNLHGSHLLGLLFTACFLVFDRAQRRPLLAALALQLAASCASPYGPWIVIDAVQHVSDGRYRPLVSEWQPWSSDAAPWHGLAPALQGALLALLGPRLVRQGASVRALLLAAAALACAGFRSMRFASDFLLFSSPLLGVGLAARLCEFAPARTRAAWLGCALAIAPLSAWGALVLPPGRTFGLGWQQQHLPVASGAWLARHAPEARLFGPMEDTWFLLFAAPHTRAFIDGRVPFYGVAHVRLAQLALARPALFDQVAAHARIDAVIVRHLWREQRVLLSHLLDSATWRVAVIEHSHVLFVRAGSAAARDAPDLSALEPFYGYAWVFAANAAQAGAIRAALAALPRHPNVAPYRSWVGAALSLRPLLRAGPEDGLRWPSSEEERARYRDAYAALEQTMGTLDAEVASVLTLDALVGALLGECQGAERALRRAALGGASDRMYVFALAELALRRGELARVRSFVAAHGGTSSSDPWIRELSRGLNEPPPACAPASK